MDSTKHTSYATPFARVKGTASASTAGQDLDIFRWDEITERGT